MQQHNLHFYPGVFCLKAVELTDSLSLLKFSYAPVEKVEKELAAHTINILSATAAQKQSEQGGKEIRTI